MSSIYESNVDPLRANDAHGISLQLVGRDRRVLELGAASGHVTKALKDLGHTVTAVERDGRFKEQLGAIADEVHITDLDWLDLGSILADQKFDVILAGDVLEHCTRPDLVLLQFHSLLAPGGFAVLSLPNVAHADVRLALLAGRFEYRSTGLLDRTHLRFFTRKTIEEFVRVGGFRVESIFGSTAPLGGTEFGAPDASIPAAAIEFVQGDRDATVYQYVLSITPDSTFVPQPSAPAPEGTREKLLAELSLSLEAQSFLAEQVRNIPLPNTEQETILRQQIDAALLELSQRTEEREELTSRVSTLESASAASSAELLALRGQLLNARDAAIGAAVELGTTRAAHVSAQSQVDSLVHQLNLLHTSRTWRIGRFMLLPLRAVRWVLRKILG